MVCYDFSASVNGTFSTRGCKKGNYPGATVNTDHGFGMTGYIWALNSVYNVNVDTQEYGYDMGYIRRNASGCNYAHYNHGGTRGSIQALFSSYKGGDLSARGCNIAIIILGRIGMGKLDGLVMY